MKNWVIVMFTGLFITTMYIGGNPSEAVNSLKAIRALTKLTYVKISKRTNPANSFGPPRKSSDDDTRGRQRFRKCIY